MPPAVVKPFGDGIVDKALPLAEEGGSAGLPASPPPPPARPATKTKEVGGEKVVSVLFLKTRWCRFYAMGRCAKGQACKFAHTKAERKPLPDFTRTKLCPDLGHCTKTSCRFAHNKDDLRSLQQQALAQHPARAAPARASAEPAGTSPQGATAGPDPSIPQQPVASAGVAKVQSASASVGPGAPVEPGVAAMRSGREVRQDRELQFIRTKLCKFFLAGCCLKQAQCNFAHGAQDLRQVPDTSSLTERPGMANNGAGHGRGRRLARTVADVPGGKPDVNPMHGSGLHMSLQEQRLQQQVHACPDPHQQQQNRAHLRILPGQRPIWKPPVHVQPVLGQQPAAWQLPLAVHIVQPLLQTPLLLGHSQPRAIHAPLAPPSQPVLRGGYLRTVPQGSPVEAPTSWCGPSAPNEQWKEQQLDLDQQQQQQQQAVSEGRRHSYGSSASTTDTDIFEHGETTKQACRGADFLNSSTVWSRNTTPGFTDYGFSRSTTPNFDDDFLCFHSPSQADCPGPIDVEEMGPRQEDVKAPRGRTETQVESLRWADMLDDVESQWGLEKSVEAGALDAY